MMQIDLSVPSSSLGPHMLEAPLRRVPDRFGQAPIPKGFQRIAGGQRSATTGRPTQDESYPAGIEAALNEESVPFPHFKTISRILRSDE